MLQYSVAESCHHFGDVPFELDLKLSVEDSPNSAGCIVDVIRYMKMALEKGLSGSLEEVSAYYFKSPAIQMTEDESKRKLNNKFLLIFDNRLNF